MPPRTDCSAGMSWGGFRLPSELRVPSIESRCVTDKAAVLHCVPRRFLNAGGAVAICLWAVMRSGIPRCAAGPVVPAGTDSFPASAKRRRPFLPAANPVIPSLRRLSTIERPSPFPLVPQQACPDYRKHVPTPQKQVSRYVSTPFRRPPSPHTCTPVDKLWISGPCLCTACVVTCGNQKTLAANVPLTCGNVRNGLWMKDSFRERSSTACRFTLGILASRRGEVTQNIRAL